MGVRIPPATPTTLYIMYKKLNCCKYCSLTFDGLDTAARANHSRWCSNNPKATEHKRQLSERSIAIHSGKNRSIETKQKISQAHKDGRYNHIDRSLSGHPHTDETKTLLRQKALASPHRRLKRKMIEYKGIWLDSTWELALAQRLDEQNIKWIRPNPIVWVDSENQKHHYFPDFYLIDYNLYLDPKNPQAVKVQQKKLDILTKQYNNIVILTTLKECKEFVPDQKIY